MAKAGSETNRLLSVPRQAQEPTITSNAALSFPEDKTIERWRRQQEAAHLAPAAGEEAALAVVEGGDVGLQLLGGLRQLEVAQRHRLRRILHLLLLPQPQTSASASTPCLANNISHKLPLVRPQRYQVCWNAAQHCKCQHVCFSFPSSAPLQIVKRPLAARYILSARTNRCIIELASVQSHPNLSFLI